MMDNSNNGEKRPMPLSMMNYILMLVGVAIIVVGFVLMSGGGEHSATEFDESIYSVQRITVAPILVIVGFAFEVFAIMWRFSNKDK